MTTSQQTSSPFDRLPDEILEHIAVVGGMSTVFSLLPVNKKFYSICSDRPALLKLAKYHVQNQKWWTALMTRISPTWLNLAKCLLADHMSTSFTNQRHGGMVAIMADRDLLRWFPELIMSGHTINAFEADNEGNTAQVTPPFDDKVLTSEEVHRIAFMEVFISDTLSDIMDQPTSLANFYKQEFVELYRSELGMADDFRPYRTFWDDINGQHSKKQLFACLIAGILREQLMVAHKWRWFNKLEHQPITTSPPQSINYLAQTKIYESDVVPFTESETPILERHLPVMVTKEFIESGRWCGYYNVPSLAGPPEWDAMMHNIKFTVLSDDSEQCVIHGRGIDGIGDFTISGTVEKANGRALLQKRYVHQHMSWSWSAYMTPCGFVGTWGGSSWGGWFWLWKRQFNEAKPFSLKLEDYTT